VRIFKRALLGKPIASSEEEHQKLTKRIALPVFSSDAISSSAYATQEILMVTALGATGAVTSLAAGLDTLVPIAFMVAILLVIVVSSYRKTIYAYPQGGGSYVVSKENLGENFSLVAAAAILVDYVLTVAVSTSAGVRAVTSIPAFQTWGDHRVIMCVVAITTITLLNLRGVKESGKLFAIPTYSYIVVVVSLIAFGLTKSYLGWFGGIDPIEFSKYAEEANAEGLMETGGAITLFVLLKGFSSGAVALTGIEAICDGVPAFRKPSSKNASRTLIMMAAILGSIFLGISILATRLRPLPLEEGETVFSQLGRSVFGEGPIYLVLQIATALILLVAANTAYADFPRLTSIVAKDGFLPRQFMNRGDRLVFSNGVIFLGAAAIFLVWIFGGTETRLIPLYAVGVFTSFTLSQAGMVRYQMNPNTRNRIGALISSIGALTTFVVLLVIAYTKFSDGAWVSIFVVLAAVMLFKSVHRHYKRVQKAISVPVDYKPQRMNHTVMVLVGRMHRGTLQALEYARSLAPNYLVAITVVSDEEEKDRMLEQWESFNLGIPLEIVYSPYRELMGPILQAVEDLDARWDNDIVTVVIPEFVVHRWWEHLLHNQSALLLKGRLLFRKNTVVTSIPYQIE